MSANLTILGHHFTSEHKDRFYKAFAIDSNQCWIWQMSVNIAGYGEFRAGRKTYLAHRYSFILHNGKWSEQKPYVMHMCDVRPCVNPAHLKAGSHKDNMADMWSKGRAGLQKRLRVKLVQPTQAEKVIQLLHNACESRKILAKDLMFALSEHPSLASAILRDYNIQVF